MAIFQYPQSLSDQDSNPATIQFQWYKRTSIKNSEAADTIVLYMPQDAAQPSTVSWDAQTQGLPARLLLSGLHEESAHGAKDISERFGASMVSNAVQAVMKKHLNSGISSADIASTSAASLGQLANPYLTMLFRGINFRQFAFQFKFTPFVPSDAKAIFNVIQRFRANSLPTGSSGSAFLGYPQECEIQYLWQGSPNPYLNRFKRSVCTSIDTNYTPQGMFAVMRDGFPASITLNLQFTEIDLVTSNDITMAGGVPSY